MTCDQCLAVTPATWIMHHVSAEGDHGRTFLCHEHAVELVTADLLHPEGHVHNPDGTSSMTLTAVTP